MPPHHPPHPPHHQAQGGVKAQQADGVHSTQPGSSHVIIPGLGEQLYQVSAQKIYSFIFDRKREVNDGKYNPPDGVFTLAVSGTGTRTGIGTDNMQKPFMLAVSGARTGHLKAIEISIKHTT